MMGSIKSGEYRGADVFFFSSRRRHTRLQGDWSSDVCSSDLLPAALQMTATYLGTKGTRLPQEFLPNTFATGAISPSGYIYLSSNGNSTREEIGRASCRERV